MSVGAAFLLNIVAVVVAACLALVFLVGVLASVAALVQVLWLALAYAFRPARRRYSTLDLIGQDLSELDRRDGLGSELL
ncbi:hypothetical protein [Arthrobacter sp. JSM 101049]|uniref:hypothetical protein n=1 Tax=Arthrobacter sp. JSM 101049 TaxID=929097 RepID=UPI0035638C09